MRYRKLIPGLMCFGLLITTAISASFAQDDERRQRGGGRGPGGPGGPGGFGGGAGLGGLLMMEQVVDHLKVDDGQKKDLKVVQDAASEEMRKMFTEMRESGGDRDGMRKKMQEFASKSESKIEEILDPVQFDRLLGLFVQRGLGQGLTHKTIAARVGVDEGLQEKIREIDGGVMASMGQMFQRPEGGGGPPDREEMRKRFEESREKMQKARKEADEKIMGLLNSDQKTKLEQLKGDKFEFPEGGFGFGGFGGPGGGRGNRGDR
jgi:Spy/CpxP family protein refolding chaperone